MFYMHELKYNVDHGDIIVIFLLRIEQVGLINVWKRAVVLLRAALIETLWVNLSSDSHHLDSCEALRDAANSQQVAAESQRKACEYKTTYLVKQMWVIIIQPYRHKTFILQFHLFIYLFCRENCKVNGWGTEDFQNNWRKLPQTTNLFRLNIAS